jgi:outer membrane immunogenic protein
MRNIRLGGLALLAAVVAVPAQAADMPVKAPPPVVLWNWNGWYIGGNIGYSWGRSQTDVSYFNATTGAAIAAPAGSITSADTNLNGIIGGGQIGINWQTGNWVAGLEADIQGSGQKGSSSYLCAATLVGGPCFPGFTFAPAGVSGAGLSLDQKLTWFGTLRGRLGATTMSANPVMIYVTGGLAYGEIKTDAALSGPAGFPVVISTATASSSTVNVGWTIGVGAEARLSGNWTGKIEYLYMDLGTVDGSVTNTATNVRANYSSRITDNILRVGVNFIFK